MQTDSSKPSTWADRERELIEQYARKLREQRPQKPAPVPDEKQSADPDAFGKLDSLRLG